VAQRREDLRAADKDRESVAEQLRHALDEGRLTLSEYDERLQQAYAARTYGDLDGILHDLPGVVPVAASQVVPVGATQPARSAPRRRRIPPWLAPMWGSWLTTTLVIMVIWVATGAHYFWPIWVFGPWGAVLLARTLGGLASGGLAPGGHPASGDTDQAGDGDQHQSWHQENDERRRVDRERRREARDRRRSDPS